jgi:hypothetical protein
MLVSGVFSASNTIHVCIQLPTSPVALRIQKIGQIVILAVYFIMVFVGYGLSGAYINKSDVENLERRLESDFDTLFYHELTFLALFLVTTLSCLLS